MLKIIDRFKGICSKIFYCRHLKVGKRYQTKQVFNMFLSKESKVVIGNSCSLNDNIHIGSFGCINIGNNVGINRNCTIVCHESISIGAYTSIGPNVLIYDHDHKFDANGKIAGFNTSPVKIGNNCWLGGGVIVLRGTTIGDNCVIGAGCVVSGNIPANSLVTNDARNLKIVELR